MTDEISIRQFLKNFDEGKYDDPSRSTQIEAGWYDWFCYDTSLKNKTIKLTKKLKSIIESDKINLDTSYVFFKNNCPMVGKLYDDFRICDLETGEVIYCVTPSSGFDHKKGISEVWGKENKFEDPLVEGTWEDVLKFFEIPKYRMLGNQYLPNGFGRPASTYYYFVNSEGKTLDKDTLKPYRGNQMERFAMKNKEQAEAYLNKINNGTTV